MGLIPLLTWVAILIVLAHSACPGPTPTDDTFDRAGCIFHAVSLWFFPVNLGLAIVARVVATHAHWSRSPRVPNITFAVVESLSLASILFVGVILAFAQMNSCGPL